MARDTPSGPTYLGRYHNWTVHLNQPSARDVIATVLAERGWHDFKISSSGNIAYQMLKHLGGPRGIALIQSKLLIQFLESLAAGRDASEIADINRRLGGKMKAGSKDGVTVPLGHARQIVRDELEMISRGSNQSRDVVDAEFFKNVNKIARSQLFPADVHRLVERYTQAKIFNLGIRVQCKVCEQRSWHPVGSIDNELQCPVCLSSFGLPSQNPKDEIKWSYKSLGPFALPKQAFGAYSVLLSVHFLATHRHPATTATFSFEAKRQGKALEADFMMFYRSAAYWERETETIFGECKSFNGFSEKDVRRMRTIATDNPGAILVFATLAPELSENDKKLLTPFVKACRKYGELDRPKNPVLILTGVELFSPLGPPQCWRNAGGAMKTFADSSRQPDGLIQLCDASQQLHLGLPTWWNDWNVEYKRKRERKKR